MKKILCLAACLLGLLAVMPARSEPISFSDVLALPQPKPDVVSEYGIAASQFGYLYLPEGEPPQAGWPVLALYHGGCWLAQFDLHYMRALADELRQHGAAVWLPEYQRIGEPGGGWPGTFIDADAALRHLSKLAPDHELDLDNLVLAGHSAGGHLALWLARPDGAAGALSAMARSAKRPQAKAVVGLAAIADPAAYAEAEGSCNQATPQLFGGSPEAYAERYALGSPFAGEGVTANSLWLLRGAEDPIVGADQMQIGDDTDAIHKETLAGAGHFDLAAPSTAAGQRVIALLSDLLSLQ